MTFRSDRFMTKMDFLFDLLDVNDNNCLERKEILILFKNKNIKNNGGELFFKMMDIDQNGEVSKEEFESFWLQLRLKLSEDQVIAKMEDFYQKFKGIDPSKAVPDFP